MAQEQTGRGRRLAVVIAEEDKTICALLPPMLKQKLLLPGALPGADVEVRSKAMLSDACVEAEILWRKGYGVVMIIGCPLGCRRNQLGWNRYADLVIKEIITPSRCIVMVKTSEAAQEVRDAGMCAISRSISLGSFSYQLCDAILKAINPIQF